ncbi:ketol-acid reductoisomerase [Gallaecimonas sp. GXIMD4217]|uniref:ketol-acid reductoisomerase n=1 Tax=Gallaecimonas sp. GXIMD4217 TaxID=3131927 RepID=UPI00311AF8C8
MDNYFNTLSHREKCRQLAHSRFLPQEAFAEGVKALQGKRIVILGCGAQGLNQGLNLRDSGLDVSYALRQSSIDARNDSWQRATEQGFEVGSVEALVPEADLVLNLTPDKQHGPVVRQVTALMKPGAALGYSHGFDVVEAGQHIRPDITVVMVAPKCPGSEVRAEYQRGFGVPTLIAVHPDNDPDGQGLAIAKAWCVGTGGHRAGVLESSFVAEVKSDLMGEQTILCGMLQAGSMLGFEAMVAAGREPAEAAAFLQYGWEQITEALKAGGISLMMARLAAAERARAFALADELKGALRPLFEKHMDDILEGRFAARMMADWANDDAELLAWREQSRGSGFEQAQAMAPDDHFDFDRAVGLVAMVKAGVELAFEVMVEAGIGQESAYYESLHELPLIANTLARKRLYEMNCVISDTAEYGNYLFTQGAMPILEPLLKGWEPACLGGRGHWQAPNNDELEALEQGVRGHAIEVVGRRLRAYMQAMRAAA